MKRVLLLARGVRREQLGRGNGDFPRRPARPQNQRQLGYYVLLAACGQNLDADNGDVLAEHAESPLGQYLALFSSPVLRKHASQWAVGTGQWKEGYLYHLATTHALYQRWRKDQKGVVYRPADFERGLEYVRRNKGNAVRLGTAVPHAGCRRTRTPTSIACWSMPGSASSMCRASATPRVTSTPAACGRAASMPRHARDSVPCSRWNSRRIGCRSWTPTSARRCSAAARTRMPGPRSCKRRLAI